MSVDAQTLSDQIVRVDHVAIAVDDSAAATQLFCGALGATFLTGGDNEDTGLRLIHLQLPQLKLELLEARRDDSPLSPWIAAHGPGFHHMTFIVDDIPTTVSALGANGLSAIGTNTDSPSWSETFIHPSGSFGALLQFVSTTRTWGVATDAFTLEDVLAGRVVWRDYLACLREPEPRP